VHRQWTLPGIDRVLLDVGAADQKTGAGQQEQAQQQGAGTQPACVRLASAISIQMGVHGSIIGEAGLFSILLWDISSFHAPSSN
jgi:hypothetical protein